jgi:hypothetical protein
LPSARFACLPATATASSTASRGTAARQDRGEFSEYRFHQLGIYTYAAGRPIFVVRHNIMIIGWPA